MPVTRTTTTTSVLEILESDGKPKLWCEKVGPTFVLRLMVSPLTLTSEEALELSNYVREETSPPPHPRGIADSSPWD